MNRFEYFLAFLAFLRTLEHLDLWCSRNFKKNIFLQIRSNKQLFLGADHLCCILNVLKYEIITRSQQQIATTRKQPQEPLYRWLVFRFSKLKLYYFSALEWCDSLSKAIRLERQEDAIQAASELLKISKIGSFIKPK